MPPQLNGGTLAKASDRFALTARNQVNPPSPTCPRSDREIFDPYAEPTDGEVRGDIIDDLGDIYRDLQRGLVHWGSGASGAALWEWRFNFQVHWAEHATSALRAIFALSAWRDVPWPSGAG